MLMRSSMGSYMHDNEKAFSVVRQATDEDATGPELLAHLIREIHDALHEGESPEDLAERVWPRVVSIVVRTTNPAVELGRRGGKKGGKARAQSLSPERRSEIARNAAKARWDKTSED